MPQQDNPQGQPKPGQQDHEQQKPEHQDQPGQQQPRRMSDTDPKRRERGDEESGQPVQLDEK